MQQENISVIRLVITVCTFGLILSGCIDPQDVSGIAGMGGDNTLASEEGENTIEMTVMGSVGDGPIVGANVVIRNRDGAPIATQISDEFARYQITISVSDSDFPLTAEVEDGTDLVTGTTPDFLLLAGIPAPGDTQVANLNPIGTLAVMIAQRMDGGLTAENLAIANQTVGSVLNFGLDTTRFSDPISTETTEQNIANIVRSSEAFGEAIRRTRDALISIGYVSSAEQVVDALSADLIDGVLDGHGAAETDPRITVVHNVASAQVALETMANRLMVGGVEATNAM